LSRPKGLYQITGYGTNFVTVNGTRHDRSLLVSAEQLLPDWPVSSLEALAPGNFAAVLEFKPAVVLLGTGANLCFPTPEVLRPLIDANIGFEVMDTGAACRTYNFLMAEGRQVLAALIIA
jgi:uncharacterized protein